MATRVLQKPPYPLRLLKPVRFLTTQTGYPTNNNRVKGGFTSSLDKSNFNPRLNRDPQVKKLTQQELLTKDILAMKDKPLNKAYFTGKVKYFELLTGLDQCVVKYTLHTPYYAVKPKPEEVLLPEQRYIKWLTIKSMSNYLNLKLTEAEYNSIIVRLDQLANIEQSQLLRLPQELKGYLANFSVSGLLEQDKIKLKKLDSLGRGFAVGRRKEASARVWLIKGEGQIVVNGIQVMDYFNRYLDKDTAIYPFTLTNTLGMYNAWVLVMGGGTTGQCQAISLAISKALLIHDPSLEPILDEAGCLTRDPRAVERKKTGQPKARKNFTWVKR